jgi:hypothetical protein
MAVSERVESVASYAEQLLHNRDVQAAARDAIDATRAAYRRAHGKDAQEIIQDKKFRRRVNTAGSAISGLWGEVQDSPPSRKPHWGRRAIVLLVLVGGVTAVLANQRLRMRLHGLITHGDKSGAASAGQPNDATGEPQVTIERKGEHIG